MLAKTFLSKTLNAVSIVAISSVLLGPVFTNAAHAMEDNGIDHPIGVILNDFCTASKVPCTLINIQQ